MLKSRKFRLILGLALVILLVLSVGCTAKKEAPKEAPKASYPSKEVEIAYHSKAGSGGDIFLRAMGKSVEQALGKPIVVNNLPGAAGATAWTHVQKAKPDGHILLGVSSTIITAPLLNPMPVTYKDFEPIAMMFTDPMVIFVPEKSPFKTLKDLVDAAKKNPDKLKIAGGTPGELGFVAGRELMKAANIKFALVPFEGGGDAAVTVLGGHLDAGIGEYAEIAASVEAGKLRIIVAFNKMPLKPEIPVVADAGYPQIKVEKLRGLVAPKGTPPEIIDKLVAVMKTCYDNPEFKKYYEANNLIPNFKAKGEFMKVMDEQNNQVKEAIAVK